MEQNIKINPTKYPNIKCDKCGNDTFITAFILKRIPGLEIGAGTEDQILDLPVYICSKCGEILDEYQKMYKLGKYNENAEESVNKEQKQSANKLII